MSQSTTGHICVQEVYIGDLSQPEKMKMKDRKVLMGFNGNRVGLKVMEYLTLCAFEFSFRGL